MLNKSLLLFFVTLTALASSMAHATGWDLTLSDVIVAVVSDDTGQLPVDRNVFPARDSLGVISIDNTIVLEPSCKATLQYLMTANKKIALSCTPAGSSQPVVFAQEVSRFSDEDTNGVRLAYATDRVSLTKVNNSSGHIRYLIGVK